MDGTTSIFQPIIQNAISSAICIDDKYVTPYETALPGDRTDDTKELYKSFRKDGNCDLDIYKFQSYDKFCEDKEYLFGNKDLLILDWELDESNAECKFADTLSILKDTIHTDFIQFVTIYTQETDTEKIALNIFSFFKYKENTKKELFEKLRSISYVEEEFDDEDEAIRIIKNGIGGYTLNPDRQRKVSTEITQKLKDQFEDKKQFGAFCQEVNAVLDSFDVEKNKIWEWMECYFHAVKMSDDENSYAVKVIPLDDMPFKTLLIDNTLVTIISKSENDESDRKLIKPKDLYKTISSIIEKVPNKFSTLISLELKHIYRKNISAFGRGFMGIDETVLLHHAKKYEPNTQYEEFYNFILSCWNSRITYKIKEELQAIDLLSPGVREYEGRPENKEIIKLNSFLTFYPNDNRAGKRKIKFGDVFLLEKPIRYFSADDEGIETVNNVDYKYLICLTQECDCLRPHKINKNFVFAIGKELTPNEYKDALANAEKNQYTFISDDKIVEWGKKFITIHIPDSEFKINDGIKFNILRYYSVKSIFLGNQKGTFTQRLANLVFSHAMRIGIDLPHL